MTLPDYREGDQVEAGSSIAEVIDSREVEIACKINEHDRSNIKAGQPAEIEFDALPGQIFHGSVKTVGGMSMKQFWEQDTGGKFDVTIQLPSSDSRLRPGLTAQVVIRGEDGKNALYIPRQALFLKDGKRVVYVKSGNGFEPREVKIQNESESRAAIEGLNVGSDVALVDPTAPRKASSSSAPSGIGGGTP
jgi:Cu(I)/Ag(I) efflux system membrane fusion protein